MAEPTDPNAETKPFRLMAFDENNNEIWSKVVEARRDPTDPNNSLLVDDKTELDDAPDGEFRWDWEEV